jgi:hypothetical protein
MNVNRRDALKLSAALASIGGMIDLEAAARAQQTAPKAGVVDVSEYWSRFYDDTVSNKGPNASPLAKRSRKTIYIHCPDTGKDLQYADNLTRTACPAIAGDVQVKLAISQYRPSTGDTSVDVTHFRIDATQTFDYMNLIAPLSWATIASIAPDKKMANLPTIDKLGFKAEAQTPTAAENVKQVVLPSGVGKFAVNLTRPANPEMVMIVSTVSTTITAALSMMTLPAISVPAVKVFSALIGKWQSHGTVIMNGNLTPVIATSITPPDLPMPQDPMPLTNGYYLMYPQEHHDELAKEFQNLTVQNGFLVRKDAASSDDLDARAKQAVPGVSYASLRVYVEKAPPGGCSTTPKSGSAPVATT